MPFERDRIRYHLRKGRSVSFIAHRFDCSEELVIDVQNTVKGPRKNYIKPEPVKETKSRCNKTPTGSCTYFFVQNGKATQCGAECEGQRCKEHKQKIARTDGSYIPRGLADLS